jgi:hypothetical protein
MVVTVADDDAPGGEQTIFFPLTLTFTRPVSDDGRNVSAELDWTQPLARRSNAKFSPSALLIGNRSKRFVIGDGTATQFQLVKRYTSGGVTRVRNITKPVAGTTVIGVNGSNVGSGWTVNTVTGVVTFSAAPANGHDVTAGFQFDVPCRFGAELDEGLPIQIASYEERTVQSVPIVEILDEGIVSEEYPYRGSTNWGVITADVEIAPLHGFVHIFEPATTGHNVFLPAAQSVPTGGPHFWIRNDGSEDLAVAVPGPTTLATLTPGQSVICYTAFDSPDFIWYAT